MKTSTKTNLILDITIFTAFLVSANPSLTGNTIHEWLSLSFAAAIVTHLLFHWKWLVKVTTEFFKKFFHQSRLNYVVDLLFFIAMTAAMLSGLMISKDIISLLGIQLDVSRSWKPIHSLASDASMILLGIHFALHWKWIVTNIGQYIANPIRGLPQPKAQTPRGLVPQPVRIQKEK
jgi:hypothetical protein